ncbi:hypothetical protein ACAH01_16085 (plasmid) [Halomicrobium sp. HM KBTZ05]|uniref:DUF7344 domain-containing protein n=1 Tax=Halomicrobium sp. HM KBTZ05 TaxID=3242663 RepID=UPI00355828D9
MATTNPRYETASQSTETSATDYYRLRSNRQRHVTITVLRERSSSVSIDALARQVSERLPAEKTVERVKVRLHHVDVPLLADAGVVAYDREAGTVQVSEPVSDLLV